MPEAVLDGINTRYEVIGDGPPLLMYAPGGFDATIEKWTTQGVYARIKLLEHLPKKYRCIVFDRRECGHSGGRVEAVTWQHYALQGKRLLEKLGIERAHVMGGCMGVSCVMAFAVAYPQATQSMLCWWPVGGAKYRIKAHERFAQHLAFVRASGGRVELITWAHYARQGKLLLEHLGIERAHVMGGCMGCSCVMAFGVAYPQATLSMLLWWPVGGAKYRINGHQRFAEHAAYVTAQGLDAVVALARSGDKSFGQDPRGGPWVSVVRRDDEFAAAYQRQDVGDYLRLVREMGRTLIDRDTSPGAEPEQLLALQRPALVVPGRDATHATSAARYLEECLPQSEYWDAPVDAQTEQTAPPRVLDFLHAAGASATF